MRVICDRMSGKSKGYGFVVFDSEEAASSALAAMNNKVCAQNQFRNTFEQIIKILADSMVACLLFSYSKEETSELNMLNLKEVYIITRSDSRFLKRNQNFTVT